MMTLSKEQQTVIDCDALQRLVLSGPGAGKSRCLVAAVAREAEMRCGPGQIVVVTYTNNAAAEMSGRLAQLGVTGLGFCGTLHAFLLKCFTQVMALHNTTISVIDDEQRETLLEQIAEDLGVRASVNEMLAVLDGLSPPKLRGLDAVSLEYHCRLRHSGLVDFNGILVEGREAAEALKRAGHWPYESLFVDEVQDAAQQDWCFYGSGLFNRKYLTGDPDQSIYKFRGGNPDMLVRLAERADHPKTVGTKYELHVLEGNHRSGPVICSKANVLIGHNKNRVDKLTLTELSVEDSVTVSCQAIPQDEMNWVSGRIASLAGSTAVLARTNYVANQFASHLASQGVRVATVEQLVRPFDWKRTKLLLTVLANPFNDTAVMTLLREQDKPKAVQTQLEAESNMTSINEHLRYMFGKGDGTIEDLVKLKVGADSRTLVHDYAKELSAFGPWTLNDLVLYIGQQEQLGRKKGDGVTCCTIHAAKGKEFDAVFVVGCDEELGYEPKDVEEERRLMFVAVTRARMELNLSWCLHRPQYRGAAMPPGPLLPRQASRFLKEMGLL